MFVVWLDIMGSKNMMTNSLMTAACYIGQLHSVIKKIYNSMKNQEITVHSMTDGAYVVCEHFETIRDFSIAVMRTCVCRFMSKKIGFTRYFVRCAIAYGKVIMPSSMIHGMPDTESDPQYDSNIMLGVPFVKAYMAEHNAPPFGIYLDESIRTHYISDDESKRISWVLHRWWNPDNKEQKKLARDCGEEILKQLKWEKRNPISSFYPVEKHDKYVSIVREYFDLKK